MQPQEHPPHLQHHRRAQAGPPIRRHPREQTPGAVHPRPHVGRSGKALRREWVRARLQHRKETHGPATAMPTGTCPCTGTGRMRDRMRPAASVVASPRLPPSARSGATPTAVDRLTSKSRKLFHFWRLPASPHAGEREHPAPLQHAGVPRVVLHRQGHAVRSVAGRRRGLRREKRREHGEGGGGRMGRWGWCRCV